MKEIKLGMKVMDVVTGFEGIVTAKVEYLNGCVQFCVKPEFNKKDRKYPEGEYIDSKQLVVIGKGVCREPKETGGDMSDSPSSSYRG
jgi:hypothetical protein